MVKMTIPLEPEDIDDGQEGRRQLGMAIAAMVNLKKVDAGYQVPSQSGNGNYVVGRTWHGDTYCTCPDYSERRLPCKHIFAVQFQVARDCDGADDDPPITPVRRASYGRNWPAYNASQENEGRHFLHMLRELCDGIPQPAPGIGRKGRPRLPLGDVVFAIGLKVYHTRSTRWVINMLKDAKARQMMEHAPSFASMCHYLQDPGLYPVLQGLVHQSALPLQAVETDFAIDSTAFTTSVYDRYYDHKWGGMKSQTKWVRAHAMCGTLTKAVTSLEGTTTAAHDALFLPDLLEKTAKHFTVHSVIADKAYASKTNIEAIVDAGALPYLMFKSNTIENAEKRGLSAQAANGAKRDGLWEQAVLAMLCNRDEWLHQYHKRSNVESLFSMVKTKFGAHLNTKTDTAQVNEILAKFLCHNICVVIKSMYLLGIDPNFGLVEDADG